MAKFNVSLFFSLLVWSTVASSQSFKTIPNWRYIPLNKEFYDPTLALIEAESFDEAFDKIKAQRAKTQGTSEEGEGRIALSLLCKKLGLDYCAYHYAITTLRDFRGSAPSLKALELIDQSLKERKFDDAELSRIINSASFQEIPESVQPMVNYYVGLDNLSKDMTSWGLKSLRAVGKANYWAHRRIYNGALELARRGKIPEAVKILQKLSTLKNQGELFTNDSRWQLARLKFELGEYPESIKIYDRVNTENRQAGQVLREKAWVQYWAKSYAEVLGLVKTLKAPQFAEAMNPETYILEMLTLRKLCHFEAVKDVTREFEDTYGRTYLNIKERKPLEDDLALVRMTFMNAKLIPAVESVSELRSERTRMENGDVKVSDAMKKELLTSYKASEGMFRREIDFRLQGELRKQADSFLEYREQVQLVDYLSGLDAFSIKQSYEKKDYKAKEASIFSYNLLYWPVGTEYWRQELKNYQVLVADRCSEGGK